MATRLPGWMSVICMAYRSTVTDFAYLPPCKREVWYTNLCHFRRPISRLLDPHIFLTSAKQLYIISIFRYLSYGDLDRITVDTDWNAYCASTSSHQVTFNAHWRSTGVIGYLQRKSILRCKLSSLTGDQWWDWCANAIIKLIMQILTFTNSAGCCEVAAWLLHLPLRLGCL